MTILTLHDTSRNKEITFSTIEESEEVCVPNPRFKSKLIVDNQGEEDITVSIPATSPSSCGHFHDLEETVKKGTVKCIRLYKEYNDKSGNVPFTISDITSVTVAAIE